MRPGKTKRNVVTGPRGSLFFFETVLTKIPEGKEMLPSIFIHLNDFAAFS